MEILVAILVLSLVVAIHEAGHFLVAKRCNVGVVEFAIGFGKSLYSRRFGDTVYSIRAIPLGGYVRMVGDDPAALQRLNSKPESAAPEVTEAPSPERLSSPELDTLEKELLADPSKWYLTKSVGQRAAIVIAGPAANLLSAILFGIITLSSFGATSPVDEPVIGQVVPEYPAAKAGLTPGDRVLSIDGNPVSTWEQLATTVRDSGGKELALEVRRFDTPRQPESSPFKDLSITVSPISEHSELAWIDDSFAGNSYKIGISAAGKREQLGFGESILYGTTHVANLAIVSLKGIAGLVVGAISLKNVGGPIFILGETMRSADQGIAELIEFIVFLSVSLAVLNLLPIPVLDGGHLVFLGIEKLRGQALSLTAMMRAQQVGFILLMGLMALGMGNDLVRVFSKWL